MEMDFNPVKPLMTALVGQDAVVLAAGALATDSQKVLIDSFHLDGSGR